MSSSTTHSFNNHYIKWSTPLPLMATVKTQQVREKRWREKTYNDDSSTEGQLRRLQYDIEDLMKTEVQLEEYPLVKRRQV